MLVSAQDFRTFARISGYVEQYDIHSPQATVKEALWFSARLRLSNAIKNSELWDFIGEVKSLFYSPFYIFFKRKIRVCKHERELSLRIHDTWIYAEP